MKRVVSGRSWGCFPRVTSRELHSTLVVFQGEVGVVGGLWSQAVVEVLSTEGLVWIHRRHRLDQLDYIDTVRSQRTEGTDSHL